MAGAAFFAAGGLAATALAAAGLAATAFLVAAGAAFVAVLVTVLEAGLEFYTRGSCQQLFCMLIGRVFFISFTDLFGGDALDLRG